VTVIESVTTTDVRFPTSRELDGSDAVNVDPDYSAAYVMVATDSGEVGHGFAFTCGRGNEIVTAAIDAYGALLVGKDIDALLRDMGNTARALVHDSQLRWLGPEKGVTQMACGALINALWDIRARRAGQPLWLLLSRLSADELVDLVDFTHITDALTRSDALDILHRADTGKADRIATMQAVGYPAYATSPGWLGYTDEKLVRLSRAAIDAGFPLIKLKVGGNLADDRRRLGLVRDLASGVHIAIDANQRWDVAEAIEWVNELAEFAPYWIEEPTSTDDILGHAEIRRGVAPTRVATGEAVANRIVFKQLLKAESIDVLQLDATRVAGVNENLAILLLAARFDVPVCPHAGGVGLCELVQHLAFFDYTSVSASLDGRMIEYVDHLHEHFEEPATVTGGRYVAPRLAGTGAEMKEASRSAWTYPAGSGWQEERAMAGIGLE
jgi:L-fuconate dehydratase